MEKKVFFVIGPIYGGDAAIKIYSVWEHETDAGNEIERLKAELYQDGFWIEAVELNQSSNSPLAI